MVPNGDNYAEKLDIERAMAVGIVLGQLHGGGFDAKPTRDSDGEYQPIIDLTIPEGAMDGLSPLRVYLLVMLVPEEEG